MDLLVFLRQGSNFGLLARRFEEPHGHEVLASKASGLSIGGAAEGVITAVRGESRSRTCGFGLGRDQNFGAQHVSLKSLMISEC